jgi:nucleoside-diphosphate-sugar epimerase
LDIYLVTGASGMLGRHVVRHLLDRNALVRVLVRPSSDVAFLDDQRVQIVAGETGDSKAIAAARFAPVSRRFLAQLAPDTEAAMSPAGLQLMSQDLHLDMSRAEGELGFRSRHSLVKGLVATLKEMS